MQKSDNYSIIMIYMFYSYDKYCTAHKDSFSKASIKMTAYKKYYIEINLPFIGNKDNMLFTEKYLHRCENLFSSEKLFSCNDLNTKYRNHEKTQ